MENLFIPRSLAAHPEIKPLQSLALVGAGMHNLSATSQPEVQEVPLRLSRTIGALASIGSGGVGE